MSSSKEIATEAPTNPPKKAIWPLNVLSALPLLYAITLMGSDSVTRAVTTLCLSVALGSAYLSVRRRFNIFGLLLLLAAACCYAAFASFILKEA